MKVDVPQKKSKPICQKLIVKAMYMEQALKFKADHSGLILSYQGMISWTCV